MLAKLLIRDETTTSLGKSEHLFIIHVSGERSSLHESICQHSTQGIKEYDRPMPALFRVGSAE